MSDLRPELLIEVYTDPMCPWCYVGHARLERFLSSPAFGEKIAPYMRPTVRLLPFILDPRLPASTYTPPVDHYDKIESTPYEAGNPPSKKEYYGVKFSGGLDAFDAKIRKAAEEESLPPFAFTTDGKVGATWDAHRLIWKASTVPPTSSGAPEGAPSGHTPSIQSRVAERLYRDFHSKSIDLSDRAKLATAAKEEGVFASKEEALKWLNSDDGEYEVGQAVMVGKMNGVESIPFYMVQDGSDHLSEVGSPEAFMRMCELVAAAHGAPR